MLCKYLFFYCFIVLFLGHWRSQKKKEDGYVFEVGLYLYTRGTKNVHAYCKGEEWWLMEASDIIRSLDQPTKEKVTDKRVVYHFKDIV